MALKVSIFLVLFAASWLVGCSAPPTAPIPPSPMPLRISYSPYLAGIQEALHTCAVELPQLAIFFEQIPAAQQDFENADLVVWWGETPERIDYAYPLNEDELVVIVNPENPKQTLSGSELVSLYSGRIENWSEIGTLDRQVEVWIFPEGNIMSETFQAGMLAEQRFTRLAKLAPSAAAMLESIAGDPGAIGFLPRSWLSPNVKGIEVEPELQNSVRKPLLVLSQSEPQGAVTDLIACLQTGSGQATLSDFYDLPD